MSHYYAKFKGKPCVGTDASTPLMIFDLITLPKGHQFDPRVNILLAFCSTHICNPRQCDMPHDHVRKKNVSPWAPLAPQFLPIEHKLRIRTKKNVQYVSYL